MSGERGPTTALDVCACGHARDWHSHGGAGDCEHDGDCGCQAFHAMRPAFPRPDTYAPEFERHASPEAIRAQMQDARERQATLSAELGWLEGLYLRRVSEKACGAWPLDERGADRIASAPVIPQSEVYT